MINHKQNHFELFGLPLRFELDLARLEQSYRGLQSRVHPDRFVQASDAERRSSMQASMRANEAYRILKHPLARACYLLELRRVDVQGESSAPMPPEFLERQMEWREAVEDAAARPEALTHLAQSLRGEIEANYAELARRLDSEGDVAHAADSVRRLMFLERLREEIGDALERADA